MVWQETSRANPPHPPKKNQENNSNKTPNHQKKKIPNLKIFPGYKAYILFRFLCVLIKWDYTKLLSWGHPNIDTGTFL